MTLANFKERLNIATRGDIRLPEIDELKIVMDDAARTIHRAVTPLEKIELDSRDFEVDYHINDKYFVRKFKTPMSDEDEIDFLDEALINALIYAVAFRRCHDEKRALKYRGEYLRAISEYELNNFDERSYDLEAALAVKGWAKPYDVNYALDTNYVWDENFISKLDFWMANIHTTRNLSYRKFIYLFVDYENGKMDPNRRDLKELDLIMKRRVRP